MSVIDPKRTLRGSGLLSRSHAPSDNLGALWIKRRENAMGRGLLVAAIDFSTAHADEFHDWYDLEHIPERQTVPGFGACERWIGDEQPTLSVATYDLDSVDVLRSKAYASIAYGNLSVWSKRVTAMCKRWLSRRESRRLSRCKRATSGNVGIS